MWLFMRNREEAEVMPKDDGDRITPIRTEQDCSELISDVGSAGNNASLGWLNQGQGTVPEGWAFIRKKFPSCRQGVRAGLQPPLTPSAGCLRAGTSCMKVCRAPDICLAQKWDSRRLGCKVVMLLCCVTVEVWTGRLQAQRRRCLPGQQGTEVGIILHLSCTLRDEQNLTR